MSTETNGQSHYQVFIVGGGAAGITVAAQLKRRSKAPLSIAIVEPSADHYYQPAFTLVGAGAYALSKTRRAEEKLIPAGVDWIQEARETSSAIIINPAAYSHTSVAILDALNVFEGVVVEVHISNIYAREEFRHHSYVTHRANAAIVGQGVQGYVQAVQETAALFAS